MKNYKENGKQFIGSSDIATLIVAGYADGGIKTTALHFGSDGSYSAYVVDQETEIPEHYKLVCEFEGWLKIYDDEEMTFRANADKIKVYRAAEMGCIIQLIK